MNSTRLTRFSRTTLHGSLYTPALFVCKRLYLDVHELLLTEI